MDGWMGGWISTGRKNPVGSKEASLDYCKLLINTERHEALPLRVSDGAWGGYFIPCGG